jgi:hypothetical protein
VLTATSSAATFAHWQPRYAEQGIPIFPVKFADGVKKPAVKGYTRIGSNRSAQLVFKFADAQAFGFMCGPTSKLTIGDVDAPGEVALYAALEMWGDTPVIIKTASGKYHCYYRHNGEGRHVRFLGPDKPYDILGGGLAVACPSQGPTGRYEFISGGFDDLHRLPVMRQFTPANENKPATPNWSQMREGDGRNGRLWYYLMGQAHGRSYEEITDLARSHNDELGEAMSEAELEKLVRSVWEYERSGMNFVGMGKAMILSHDLYDRLEDDPDALSLFLRLKRVHWHRDKFILSTAMAKEWRWGWSRFKAAVTTLVRQEIIACLDEGGRGPRNPPIYAWVNKRG